MAVAALKEPDFLSDSCGDGCGQAAFAGGDTGEPASVRAAGGDDPAQSLTEHLRGERAGHGTTSETVL